MRMAITQPTIHRAMVTQPMPTAMGTQRILTAMAATTDRITGLTTVPRSTEDIESPDALRSTALVGTEAACGLVSQELA